MSLQLEGTKHTDACLFWKICGCTLMESAEYTILSYYDFASFEQRAPCLKMSNANVSLTAWLIAQ